MHLHSTFPDVLYPSLKPLFSAPVVSPSPPTQYALIVPQQLAHRDSYCRLNEARDGFPKVEQSGPYSSGRKYRLASQPFRSAVPTCNYIAAEWNGSVKVIGVEGAGLPRCKKLRWSLPYALWSQLRLGSRNLDHRSVSLFN